MWNSSVLEILTRGTGNCWLSMKQTVEIFGGWKYKTRVLHTVDLGSSQIMNRVTIDKFLWSFNARHCIKLVVFSHLEFSLQHSIY